MIFKRFTVSFLIALLTYLPASAQTLAPARKEQKELEKKAIALVEDVVNEAMSLRLVENRIYALTTAAELIWKHNEDRARALLREAVDQFMAMEQPSEPDDPRTIQAFQIRMELRTQLLQMLATRDAPLALDFLRASRLPDARTLLGGATPDFEREFEMQLAVRIAENDPRAALKIAEESLKEGLTHQVYEIWMNLIAKDSTAAAKLSSEMVAKMKSSDLMKNYQGLNVAFSMLYHLRSQIQSAQKSAKEPSKNSPSPSSSSQSQSSPASLAEMQQMYREVLEVVASATLRVTAAQLLDIQEQGQARNLLTQVQALTPEIEKYLPARAAAVRAKLAQFDKAFYRPPAPPEPYEELEKKTPDELVAMAAKSPEEIKESLYRQAIAKAMESDDPARARQIAKDFLPNGGLGDPMVAEIEQKEREQALKQGKLEEARKSLARLRSDEERALALIELAAKAEANKDQKTHRQLLEEASGLIGDQMDTRMQVEVQLALAIAYLNVDADRSFEILGSAIDRLNTVLGAVMTLTRFDQGGLPFGATSKEGEMRLNAGEFGNVTTNLDQRIVAFARKDFDRTVAALKQWEVNEIRLAMNLMLASNILGENKEAHFAVPFFGERIH